MSEFWERQESLQEYPLLLEAIHRQRRSKKDAAENTYMDIMAAWKREEDVFSAQFISFMEEKPAAILGIELYDKDSGLMIGNDFINSENIYMLEGIAHFQHIIPKKKKAQVRQKVHFMWLEPDGTVKTGEREQDFEFLEDQIVDATTVSAPRAKNNKQTIVLYGREPFAGEVEDYKYKDNHQKDGKVKAILPVQGEVVFHDDFEIKEVCFDSQNAPVLQLLFTTGDSPVLYGGDYQKAFRIEGQKLYFEFDEDWNTEIDVHRFQASTVMNLHLVFKVTVLWKGLPYTLSIIVESLEQTNADTPTTAVIEPISIRWGCLGKDTAVTMADGVRKKISDIQIGDIVRTSNGGGKVTDIYKGYEEEIVCLETTGTNRLFVTDSHPVRTPSGMTPVRRLCAADSILMENGVYEPLATLSKLPYKDMTYNLALEGEHTFYANGILVGDFEAQNSISNEDHRHWPQNVLELQAEMKRFGEKLKKES